MSESDDPYRLQELIRHLAQSEAMGGGDKIKRQHAKNRLTARERVDLLLDQNSFEEIGQLAHSDRPATADATPADGKLAAYGRIDGRRVFVGADDVTVMAGAGGRVGVAKLARGMAQATERGYPIVQLGDAGGARVPDIMGSAGMMSMVYPIDHAPRCRRVPQITAILGECFGGSAWTAAVSDIVIQVKGTAMCVGGPSILEIATGEKASTEDLGGWQLHARITGQVDLFAEDDAEALALVRRTLSYFPDNHRELPPRIDNGDPAQRRIDDYANLVPADPRQGYDMHRLLQAMCDAGSLLELKPDYDASLITALARLDGHVVGVLASNPKVTAGAMGPGACEKATSFLCLCDSFHIPLLFVHDTPGFFVGRRAEERQMPLKIMNWIAALAQCSVPRIGLIVRKSYGMAHCNMAGGNMGDDCLLAWPCADVSFMAPAVAVNVVHGRKLAKLPAEQGAAERERLTTDIARANAPWEAAGRGYIDRVIDPADTRIELIAAFDRSRGPDGLAGRSRRHLANWPRMA